MSGKSIKGRFTLRLLGPFGLFRSDGSRIEISSKKSIAILAMLATAPNGLRVETMIEYYAWVEHEHCLTVTCSGPGSTNFPSERPSRRSSSSTRAARPRAERSRA
mgnify:CR=1 FL=1